MSSRQQNLQDILKWSLKQSQPLTEDEKKNLKQIV
jgi:hypothetical protein